jgi:hypothetical protein
MMPIARQFNLAAERPLPDLHSPGGLEDLSESAVHDEILVASREPTGGCCCGCNMIRSQFRTGVAGMTPLDVMWVGLGGGLGSLLRWLTRRVIGEHYHGDFPVGTSRGQRATMTTNLRHSAD